MNHVVLGIVIGMIVVNVFKVPAWAGKGVRTARFFLVNLWIDLLFLV